MTATLGAIADRIGASIVAPSAPSAPIDAEPAVAEHLAISDVVHDSRQIAPGQLFVAVGGADHDGHDHAGAAVERGAVALLVERVLPLSVPQLLVPHSRAAMGPAAALVHGDPSRSLALIGVTGTNGKTTVVSLIGQILDRLGRANAVIGTLTGARTTPEATDLQRQLRGHVDAGIDVVAMEVSSHALALHRVDGCRFRVGVFTNLGRDHLDFHGTPERYYQAKARLFDRERVELAVLNVGDVRGRLLRDVAEVPVLEVDLGRLDDLHVGLDGSSFRWRGCLVELPMAGEFNVVNALAAAESVVALGVEPPAVAAALATVDAPPGRLQRIRVATARPAPAVFVDYAHTPDAIEEVLTTLRAACGPLARLVIVVGCGGDRDRSKRPHMAHVAATLADHAWFTSDNPRSEDPAAIMGEMVAGVRPDDRAVVHTEIDRRAAIDQAISHAGPDDVVVIAGKGHETTQTIGADVVPFDDRDVASAALVEHFGSVDPE